MIPARTTGHEEEGARAQSHDPEAAPKLLVVLHHLFALAPALALISVYTFSLRIATVIGHWPKPSIDDPKFAAPGDSLSTLLYIMTMLLLVMSTMALFVVPILSLGLRRAYPRVWAWLLPVICIVSWLVIRQDPGARITWLLD